MIRTKQKVVLLLLIIAMLAGTLVGIFMSISTVNAEEKQIDDFSYNGSSYKSYVYLKMSQDVVSTKNDSGNFITDATNFLIYVHCTGTDDGAFWPTYKYKVNFSLQREGALLPTTKSIDWAYGRKEMKTAYSALYSASDISRDGKYTLSWTGSASVDDTRALSGSYVFYVDRAVPTLSGKENGQYTNANFTIKGADANFKNLSYSHNGGAAVTSTESSVTIPNNNGDGQYTFTASDLMDRVSTPLTVYLDTIKPILSSGIASGGYANSLTTISVSDTNHSLIYYKSPKGSWANTSASTFKMTAENGEWQFYAKDKAGNQSDTYIVFYDGVPPVVGLRKADGSTFLDGAWVNQGVYFDVSDTNYVGTKLYKWSSNRWNEINSGYLSGNVYFDTRVPNVLYGSQALVTEAIYAAELSKITTKKDWKIIVDDRRIIPSSQLDFAIEGADYYEYTLSSGEIYVYFNYTELLTFVKSKASTYVGSSSREMFSQEGHFKVEAIDKGGNVTAKTFRIDFVAPTFTISANGYTNQSIVYSSTDSTNGFTISWRKDGGTWQYLKANVSSLTIAKSYGDGTYIIRTVDEAGNAVSASLVLDTEKPNIVVDVENGGYTNRTKQVNVVDGNFLEFYVKSPTGEYERFTRKSTITTIINGIWQFYAVDKAGNQSDIYSWTFDNVAPTGQAIFNGNALIDYHNNQFSLLCNDETMADKVMYKAPNGEWVQYTTEFYPVEGIYRYKSYDKAGNSSNEYSLEIDLTAPIINTKKNGATVDSGVWANANDELKAILQDRNAAYIEVDGVRLNGDISISALADGDHIIIGFDKAGNSSSEFIIKVDKILPEMAVYREDGQPIGGGGVQFYANSDTVINAHDRNFYRVYISKDNGGWDEFNADNHIVEATASNFGTWRAYADDMAGNRSQVFSITLQVISDFGNQSMVYNRYKLAAWYEVTLPAYVFDTGVDLAKISGKYTFEKQSDAYAWALRLEEQYRVRSSGDNWIYVSAASESVPQVYTSRTDLDKVIAKYASRYVSGRKVMSASGNDSHYIIKDAFGKSDESAFVRQDIKVPHILSDYASLPIMQVRHDYKFIVSRQALAPTAIRLVYLSDGFTLSNKQMYSIGYSSTLRNALQAENGYRQGYYLAEESDLCGNKQLFLVFIDIEAPGIKVNVEKGDGSWQEHLIDADDVDANAALYYYISFNINSLVDNIDSLLAIKVQGRGINDTYITGDGLPYIDYQLGGGQYTITIYDRSANSLTFKVNIAFKQCSMEYNSLKEANKQLTLSFRTNDYLNQIVGLEIYKVNGVGEAVRLERDDLGKDIDFTTMEYNFTVGGKFYAVITDRYGRRTQTTPIFYQRGLPRGELSTDDYGVVNKDVTFKYTQGTNVNVYVVHADGRQTIFTNYEISYDSMEKTYLLTFVATLESNNNYLIYLYSELDDNLFIEYRFGIDTVVAVVTATDKNGNVIDKGGATTKTFSLRWTDDGVRVKYTFGNDSTMRTYSSGDILSASGLYTFTVTDKYGNIDTFTIYLDSVVDYTITGDGKIVNTKEKCISNKPITLTVTEVYSKFQVTSDNGKLFASGVAIIHEGNYTVVIEDRYGNTITINIEIDYTAPTVTLNINGSVTLQDVTVTFEGGSRGYLVNKNVVVREIMSGEVFTAHGGYSIIIEDIAGNRTIKEWHIDKKVDYTANVSDKQITTENVSVSLTEGGAMNVKYNGASIDVAEKYELSGAYVITLIDSVGNMTELHFTILSKAAQEAVFRLYDGQSILSAMCDGEVVELMIDEGGNYIVSSSGRWEVVISDNAVGQSYKLYLNIDGVKPEIDILQKNNTVSFSQFNKSGVTALLTKDSKEVKFSTSTVLKAPGKYTLMLSDEFGNTNSYEFEIVYKLSVGSIVLIVISAGLVISLVVILLRKRFKVKIA